MNIVQKILRMHLIAGDMMPGNEITIRVDQTLTQDATGTLAYLQFEAIGAPRIKTEFSISYVDHNMLQTGYENADDHRYLRTVAAKYGIHFSKPGNGICHQVHLERFALPGKTLLGSDSHTPMSGGIGMLGIGVGGLDIAAAMATGEYHMAMPKVINIHLLGKLERPWVTAKDVILEILRRLTVKGGVGKVVEYSGIGSATLSVAERATITNMGAELGATTSIFPSDNTTRIFMQQQKRSSQWTPLVADENAHYEERIEIDLREIQPLIAQPHSPDNVTEVAKIKDVKVDQVCIGSCTNSSYEDLMTVARLLKGRKIHQNVDLVITPGSRQVLQMIAGNGALAEMILSGARILEVGCGPCIGMGQAPRSGGTTVRTYNRNFCGRSGTEDAKIYLSSPVVAVACALEGRIVDPRSIDLGFEHYIRMPNTFKTDDSLVLPPSETPSRVNVHRGPNIKPIPKQKPLPKSLSGEVLLKVGDNITTDDILPGGAKVLPLRSNIPAISKHTFSLLDPTFAQRAKSNHAGFIVGGDNYGQGSSREHAALAPMYLGIKAVIARSFARIHRANLVNFGILPLVFEKPEHYDAISLGDCIELADVRAKIKRNLPLILGDASNGDEILLLCDLTERQREIILAGGLLNLARKK